MAEDRIFTKSIKFKLIDCCLNIGVANNIKIYIQKYLISFDLKVLI